MNKFSRKCGTCDCDILYKSKSQYNDAVKHDRICKLCSNKKNASVRKIVYDGNLIKECNICGYKHTFSSYKKYRNAKDNNEYLCKLCAVKKTHKNKIVSDDTKKLISDSRKIGWKNGEYDNAKILWSKNMSGKNNPMYGSNRTGSLNPFYGKTHTLDTKKYLSKIHKKENLSNDIRYKMSLSAKNRVIKSGMPSVNYNSEACKIIDNYGNENGYNFQHAENGGEYKIRIDNIHYFVDGYDKDKNIVIEYYENFHKWNIEKDKKRKQKIIDKLDCEFIELKEWELHD